jgi:hypothetical protein
VNIQDQMKRFWVNVANYYRQQIPNDTIAMYAYDTRDLSLDELRSAFEQYRSGKKAEFFPIPAVLKNIVRPPFDEDAESNEVVARIVHCLSPFKSGEAAREYMGELAWEVVRGLGGWSEFGRRPPPDGFAIRDMKEMAKSKLIRAKQGRANELPSLPGSDRPQIAGVAAQVDPGGASRLLTLASDALKGKTLE